MVGLDMRKLQMLTALLSMQVVENVNRSFHGMQREDQEKDLVQAMVARPRMRTSQMTEVTLAVEEVVGYCCPWLLC